MDVSLTLGVSQKTIEEEFYMIDLPLLLEKKRKNDAIERLNQLVLYNAASMDQSDFKQFVNDLTKQAGIKQEQKFSREKIEQLRSMLRGF